MPDFEAVEKIEGWLFPEEMHFLYECALTAVPNTVILEVGSWRGKSTICLALGSKHGTQCMVYAIDPHLGWVFADGRVPAGDTLISLTANLKQFELTSFVTPIVATSKEASQGFEFPVSVLFIDGDHSPASVALDIDCWVPKLIPGGTLIFHDYYSESDSWRGVQESVNRLILPSEFEFVRQVRCSKVFRKL